MKMDHERCSELLLPFLQGELDPDSSRQVEEHLSACDDCRKEHGGLAALFAEPVEPLNDLEKASLHRNLREEISIPAGTAQERARLSWLPQALGVAALLLVVVVGIQYFGEVGGDDEAGSEAVEGADLAAPEGPDPVTLKLTSSGVQKADPISAGAGAGAAVEPDEEAPSEAAPDAAQDLGQESEEPTSDSSNQYTVRMNAGVESALKTYARTSPTFTRFAETYRAEDVEALAPAFIAELADGAPEGSAVQVTQCANLVVTSREFPTLPAAAAHGVFRKEDSLLLGFVWTEQETGPLDNYVIYVWPVGGCESPTHSQSGRIRTGDR